jgi:hypothetical protein
MDRMSGHRPNKEHPPGPPMTLGNMCELGVHHYCVNDACRHSALIVSSYGGPAPRAARLALPRAAKRVQSRRA